VRSSNIPGSVICGTWDFEWKPEEVRFLALLACQETGRLRHKHVLSVNAALDSNAHRSEDISAQFEGIRDRSILRVLEGGY
jgi:hypothetical protein